MIEIGTDSRRIRRLLIDKTRLRLEEWTRGERTDFWLGENSEDAAFYPIVSYINEYLDEATKQVLLATPLHRLSDVATDFDRRGFYVDKGIGYLPLPHDFLKVEGVQMKNWTRKCYATLKVTDEEYKVQQHKHVRGIKDKPQIAIAFGNIEIYSCCDNDNAEDIIYAKYIPMLKAEETPDRLWNLLTCNCAEIVAGVLGDTSQQQILQQQFASMLELEQV